MDTTGIIFAALVAVAFIAVIFSLVKAKSKPKTESTFPFITPDEPASPGNPVKNPTIEEQAP